MQSFNDYFAHTAANIGLSTAFIGEPIIDGTFKRFSTGKTKSLNKNGYYILRSLDGFIFGTVGCWQRGVSAALFWTDKLSKPQALGELARQRASIEQARRALDELAAKEQVKLQAQARQRAADILAAAHPASLNYPYLVSKGIEAHAGLFELDGRLVVPLYDIHGELQTLQFIDHIGNKRFLTGGKVAGAFHLIGKAPETGQVLVCEGMATGSTLYKHTGHTVACAMNAGNLKAVAVAWRQTKPWLNILIACDNDRFTPGNPGLTKGREAAAVVHGLETYPLFPEGSTWGTDYNDLYQQTGGIQ